MRSWISLVCSLFLFVNLALAQDAKVTGGFIGDSVKIGEQIPYTLAVRHPKNLTVLFPDSTFSFAPFEYQKKNFFTTRTANGQSYDSVVYLLSTYEIDSVQQLKLPVFAVHRQDCTAIFSAPDEVILQQMIRHVPDSVAAKDLPLKTNTNYLNVKWLFNYPLALIVSGVLLVLAIASFFVFGKRVQRYFYLKRLTRNHRNFINKYSDIVSALPSNFSTLKAESALVLWKFYMENLVQIPYSKLTSKEILEKENNERLGQALHSIDRVIYGGLGTTPHESFEHLRNHCEQQFQLKFEEAKNG